VNSVRARIEDEIREGWTQSFPPDGVFNILLEEEIEYNLHFANYEN
jgi:hypothetical protein